MIIAKRLKIISNNYLSISKKFQKKLAADFLSDKPLSLNINFTLSVSIIIPAHNSANTILKVLLSLNTQVLLEEERKLIEIIIVDDGSTDNTSKEVLKFKSLFVLKYIKQIKMGRSIAKNRGVFESKGKIIIFLNADVIPDPYFIREHLIRHEVSKKLVLISFQESVKTLSFQSIKGGLCKPKINQDFRFERNLTEEWLEPHRPIKNVETRVFKILDETDDFRDFGHDKIVGVWDLPSMVIPNGMSLRRVEFEKVGGFSTKFKGWGMEDTFFGACLIVNKNYIVPIFSTGVYHIKHAPRSGSRKALVKEYMKNVKIYQKLIN